LSSYRVDSHLPFVDEATRPTGERVGDPPEAVTELRNATLPAAVEPSVLVQPICSRFYPYSHVTFKRYRINIVGEEGSSFMEKRQAVVDQLPACSAADWPKLEAGFYWCRLDKSEPWQMIRADATGISLFPDDRLVDNWTYFGFCRYHKKAEFRGPIVPPRDV